MDFITIDVLKIEQQHYSYQYIITLPMTPIINICLNKHPMSWELIHRRLLHPSDSVLRFIFRHKTLTSLPKHFPKKLNQAPWKIFYTEKMTTFHKGKTFDTTNLQPVEIIFMDFAFYDVNSLLGFTSVITVICANTRIIWLFPTTSKRSPVRIIHFVLTTLKS